MKKIVIPLLAALTALPVSAEFIYRTPAGVEVGNSANEESGGQGGSACSNLSVGDQCAINGENVIYAGDFNGESLYMALTNQGETFVAGTYGYTTGATSNDGHANSRTLFDAALMGYGSHNPMNGYANPYLACMNKGSNWYVPSSGELSSAITSLVGAGADGSFPNGYHVTSSESHSNLVVATQGSSGASASIHKYSNFPVRCFAKDQEQKLLGVGPRNNVALIGTNGLTTSSYSVSSNNPSDVPQGAFDGVDMNYNGNDYGYIEGIKNRGFWIPATTSEEWIQVDFGPNKTVNAAGISIKNHWLAMNGVWGHYPKDMTVKVSMDGVNFTDHQTFTNMDRQAVITLNFASPLEARFVRFHFHSNYGDPYLEIGDIEIFE
ncbi:discoidin domain-containing protein [Neptuniibacter sp. QD37_11]|uniref:discoidin domain-containing protein n=1 Tax=Neptuniibacter sp. QD37_11 TaxID=3398209 RepID=UPI0039F5493A